jgi:NIPSNAP
MTALRNATGVVELRQYTLRPGRRDELIELFEHEFVESQEAAGMKLLGTFRDARSDDRFVWLRAFPDMDARKQSLTDFYAGPVWQTHRNAANATMLDSDNVLLLRPRVLNDLTRVRPPLLALTYLNGAEPNVAAIERNGGIVVASFESETSPNTYPRLPVREDVRAAVLLISGVAPEDLPDDGIDVVELVPTKRSRIQLAFVGKPHDFCFLNGEWAVTHRKLRERLRNCSDWETFTASCRHDSWCDGVVSVDEFDFPATRSKGCSIRHLDVAAGRWTIQWTTSRTGKLFPPVHGGFDGDRGEFYGTDVEGETQVLARFLWSGRVTGSPRWEQAFSTDGGRTWETNWIMEFARRRDSE